MDKDDIEFRPVFTKDGEVLLFDIFLGEEWCGSRRTMRQALDQANRILGNE